MILKNTNTCAPAATTIVNNDFYQDGLSNNNNRPGAVSTEALIGSLQLHKNTEWKDFEEQLSSIFLSHISHVMGFC